MKTKVFFKDKNHNTVCGVLSEINKNYVVIICHGLSVNKDTPSSLASETAFNKKNISTLRIDLYGHGESSGAFREVTPTKAAMSILAAIDFVKKSGFKKIALVGGSFAGIAVIIVLSKNKDVCVFGVRCSTIDYKEKINTHNIDVVLWKKQGYLESEGTIRNYSYCQDYLKIDGYALAKKILVPGIIIHGDKDETASFTQSIKLHKCMKNSELHIIKGADHKFTQHFDKMMHLLVEYISTHLKN